MRGKDKLNFEAFDAAAAALRKKGLSVFSPADGDRSVGFTGSNGERSWKECIIQDAKEVLEADFVVLLPGWEQSRGVFAELAILAGGKPKGARLEVYELNGEGGFIWVPDPLARFANTVPKDPVKTGGTMREFGTGATRNVDTAKPDYEGFLSPVVLEAFGEYMHEHRFQADGKVRDSDNWQKGIPMPVYIKSLWRHFMHLWMLHRGVPARDETGNQVTMKATLSAIMFNVMGYFHEWLKETSKPPVDASRENPS